VSSGCRHWQRREHDEGIVELRLDCAGARVNTLGSTVLEELEAILGELEQEPPAGLILSSGKDSGFIAGADVREFQSVAGATEAEAYVRRVHRIFDRLEQASFPSAALIKGFCLGGGLELALACHYRVVVDEPATRLGFPEVLLGIHPGFGGTWRAIATCGAPRALAMMLTGRNQRPAQARAAGLVDECVPERHAFAAARRLLLRRPPRRRPPRLQALAGHPLARALIAAFLKRQVAARARPDHYPAPQALIELWRREGGNRERMLAGEARSVAALVTGATAGNLTRLFLLQEDLKAAAGEADAGFDRMHVVGAGTMGGDIAAWCAYKGLRVTLQDRDEAAIGGALQRAERLFERRERDPARRRAMRDRLLADPEGLGVASAGVIVEAIVEDLGAKQALFQALERSAPAEAILATNTSSIALEAIGGALAAPGRLVGLHFFNPVARMQLVEVIHGRDTGADALARAAAFACAIDRLPLPVRSSPGFLVNRTLIPYMLEAVVLAEEGWPLAVIDASAREFGMPMGPVEVADSVGLDVCLAVAETARAAFGATVPGLLREKVRRGHLGRKTDKGFYEYRAGKPHRHWRERLRPPRPEEAVTQRLVLRYLNEAVACLDEGIVERAELADAGLVYGSGFAPFRGGPLAYIRARGIEHVREQLTAHHQRLGDRFRPCEGWSRLESLLA